MSHLSSLPVCILTFYLFSSYQVRFALLQAAHDGTPQRRIRFFLVAAKQDQVLPELPQPTHDFHDAEMLTTKSDSPQDPVTPMRMTQ